MARLERPANLDARMHRLTLFRSVEDRWISGQRRASAAGCSTRLAPPERDERVTYPSLASEGFPGLLAIYGMAEFVHNVLRRGKALLGALIELLVTPTP